MEDNNRNPLSLEGLRSIESREKAFLRCVNRTRVEIELMWIDFNGDLKRYQLVQPNCFVDIDTFKTHPWIARDVVTKDRMQLELKYVYMPMTTREHFALKNPNMMYPIMPADRRKLVYITLPVHSLRLRSLMCLRDLFKGIEGVDELEIPYDLKQDLKEIILRRNPLGFERSE